MEVHRYCYQRCYRALSVRITKASLFAFITSKSLLVMRTPLLFTSPDRRAVRYASSPRQSTGLHRQILPQLDHTTSEARAKSALDNGGVAHWSDLANAQHCSAERDGTKAYDRLASGDPFI